jgi:hypothetical protein
LGWSGILRRRHCLVMTLNSVSACPIGSHAQGEKSSRRGAVDGGQEISGPGGQR